MTVLSWACCRRRRGRRRRAGGRAWKRAGATAGAGSSWHTGGSGWRGAPHLEELLAQHGAGAHVLPHQPHQLVQQLCSHGSWLLVVGCWADSSSSATCGMCARQSSLPVPSCGRAAGGRRGQARRSSAAHARTRGDGKGVHPDLARLAARLVLFKHAVEEVVAVVPHPKLGAAGRNVEQEQCQRSAWRRRRSAGMAAGAGGVHWWAKVPPAHAAPASSGLHSSATSCAAAQAARLPFNRPPAPHRIR